MKIKYLLLLIIIVVSCKPYEPFSSRKEKRKGLKLIEKTLKLSDREITKLSGQDSILYSIVLSTKTLKLSKDKVKMRLDSFFKGSYDRKQLAIMLELDRNFPGTNFHFEKGNGEKIPEFKNVKELKKFMAKIDSTFQKEIIIKVDSIKKKKN